MKKMMLVVLSCIAWFPYWSPCMQLRADEPLPPPKVREVWSPNRQFCAVMDPKSTTTVVYEVNKNGRRTKSWAMNGWFRVAELADDGEHLITGHDGINLLPISVTKNEPMIRFVKRGKLLNTVTLGDIFTDLSTLKRTVSHYHWGEYRGLDEKGRFVVETVEGKKLAFDITTGKAAILPERASETRRETAAKEENKEQYIPKDLDDCFVELRRILPPKTIEEMKNGSEEDMIRYHHGLGTWLRNNWGLWKGSRLSKWFNDTGIRHPDDMSGIIFDSFWRHLNGKPIKLDEQIKYYQDYWKKVKEQEKRGGD